jgi:hypothetical protein
VNLAKSPYVKHELKLHHGVMEKSILHVLLEKPWAMDHHIISYHMYNNYLTFKLQYEPLLTKGGRRGTSIKK